ncbi:MAG: NTP transferase domain-containing protein, partial [Thiobacillus sp.]|nr:NTP transferase domain-containing protein [Thiobacillus sp.]
MPGRGSKLASVRVAAVILAGGQGRRMGGADKGLIDYRGRPLVEWALAALAPQVGEILISANRNLDLYAAYGHRVLPDTMPDFPG